MSRPLRFSIECWRAWVPPPLRTLPARAATGAVLEGETGPDVSFIPLMQRRRLSPMARAAVAAAWPCMEGGRNLPLVCCSLHGETHHCFPILTAIARGEEVSPSRFALSVHGAVGGLLSQLSGSRAPYVAVAPGGEGYASALLEAAGLLEGEGAFPAVLVVWHEQPLPAVYHRYAPDPPGVMALAVRLGPWREGGGRLSVVRKGGGGARGEGDPLLQMIAGFGHSSGQWRLPGLAADWIWTVENA